MIESKLGTTRYYYARGAAHLIRALANRVLKAQAARRSNGMFALSAIPLCDGVSDCLTWCTLATPMLMTVRYELAQRIAMLERLSIITSSSDTIAVHREH